MMSCSDFEPWTPCFPTTGLEDASHRRQDMESQRLGMKIYSAHDVIKSSCPLVQAQVGLIFLVVKAIRANKTTNLSYFRQTRNHIQAYIKLLKVISGQVKSARAKFPLVPTYYFLILIPRSGKTAQDNHFYYLKEY